MTHFEEAVILACKAFLKHYETTPVDKVSQPSNSSVRWADTAKVSAYEPASNGIPRCPVHDRVMLSGQYGYYCSAKEADPDLANKKGYCNYKADR